MDGQYGNPLCVIALNTAEQWSRDVSEDVAAELLRRCELEGRELPDAVQDFVEPYAANPSQLTLRFAGPG
jgi:hypothetical protein